MKVEGKDFGSAAMDDSRLAQNNSKLEESKEDSPYQRMMKEAKPLAEEPKLISAMLNEEFKSFD